MLMDAEPSGLIRITQLFLLSTAWGMQIWVTFIAAVVAQQEPLELPPDSDSEGPSESALEDVEDLGQGSDSEQGAERVVGHQEAPEPWTSGEETRESEPEASSFVLFRSVSRHTFGLVQSKLFPFYFYTLLGCTMLNLAIFAAYHPWELLSTRETVQIALFSICLILFATNASWLSKVTTETMFKMQEIEREHGLGQEVGHSGQREAYQLLKEKDGKYQHLRQKFFKFHGLSSLCNLACVICTGVNLAFIALQLKSL